MKNYAIILSAILILAAGCKMEKKEEVKQSKKPNVVLFFTDDNAFWYWGFGGGPDLSPNIDAIAENGLTCTQFYTPSSVCTPSRYSLHTGKYAGRCEAESFLESFPTDEPYSITWNTMLDASRVTTMGEVFQSGGYKTGFVGKWHLSIDQGERYGFKADDDPSDPEVDRKLKAYHQDMIDTIKSTGYDYAASITPYNNDWHIVEAVNVHNLEWYAKGAIDFIEEMSKSEEPFFLIVNITTHHGPCHIESINADPRLTQAGYVEGLEGIMPPRETIFERIEAAGEEANFHTAGSVWTDDLVQAVVKKLQDKAMIEETAVIFTTDHNRFDGKGTCYQGGVHIPYVMQYPAVLEAGSVSDQRFSMIDVFPTLMDMCSIELPSDAKMDGTSVWSQLSKQEPDFERDLYFEFGFSRAVLSGDYKYIAFRYSDELIENMKNDVVDEAYTVKGQLGDEATLTRYPHYFDADQLYNIKEDYEEQNNLAAEDAYSDELEVMKEKLDHILSTFEHPFPLNEVDNYVYTEKYLQQVEKAREINMDQYYWYQKGCY